MKEVHEQAYDLAEKVARAIQAVVPKGFRAKLQIVVDNGIVTPQNVVMELRPPQPRAGDKGAALI